jgi:dTDP-4-amino-4,6-dideoxygalactose transaminase
MLSRYKLISCELAPNYQLDDVWVAKRSLFGLARFESSQNFCQNWFINYLNLETNKPNSKEPKTNQTFLAWTDNGRTALYAILKSLELELESEILIQGFSCVVLPNSVWQAGYKPILVEPNKYDYNLDVTDLESKITPKTKAVIVQNTFGIAPNMQKLVDLCKKHQLILIEDCAHSLGLKYNLNGRTYPAGTVGQASFFSFGRDKVVSSTIGGLGVINPKPAFDVNTDYAKWNKKFQEVFQSLPKISLTRTLQALLYPIIIRTLVRPWYHLQIGKVILILSRKLKFIGSIYTAKEQVGTSSLETNSKYPKRLFPLLQNQLLKLDKFNLHRKKLARYYASELELDFDTNNIYMRFPIDCQDLLLTTQKQTRNKLETTDLYQQIKTNLRKEGILVGQWYTSLFMQPSMNYEAKFPDSIETVSVAKDLANNRVLNLPTNIFVSQKDATRIVDVIKQVVGDIT